MGEHPSRVRRRLAPDEAQLQIILGSLLGSARIEGDDGERRMRVTAGAEREDYVRWKYERLGPFAGEAPCMSEGRVEFTTIPHPIFDELAQLFDTPHPERAARVRALLRPLGLAVWMADKGRIELRAEVFVPVCDVDAA